jgi:hypothetical protein
MRKRSAAGTACEGRSVERLSTFFNNFNNKNVHLCTNNMIFELTKNLGTWTINGKLTLSLFLTSDLTDLEARRLKDMKFQL